MRRFLVIGGIALAVLAVIVVAYTSRDLDASSHREAPLISNDPLADNCDLWAYRSPEDDDFITIVATYVPLELPEGGPNYGTFGENIRYEIHIKNKTSVGALGSATDDITYRFTFTQTNQDPTTFFNIRLGQNLKTTYTCEKSTDGGVSFTPIISNGIVPPNNIGPRSISFTGSTYDGLVAAAIATAGSGEKVFCGPRDDAFFVDLGGIFDLGQTRRQFGPNASDPQNARDAVAGFNTHAIVMNIPISVLQKDGLSAAQAESPIDPSFVIGVWASASRPSVTTLSPVGAKPTYSGEWVLVSRLGMPLTNEAIIPIQDKDYWNAVTPYSADEQNFVKYFANLELSLYMQDGGDPGNPTAGLGDLIPGLNSLRVQTMSYPAIGVIPSYTLPGFDFRFGKDGAFAVTKLIPPPDLSGTAFAVPIASGLVGAGQPRLVDIYPIFYFGVPNAIPYQLATGKTGGPLSAGKPFIHNFLPLTNDNGVLYGGDLLRLNMATPVTDRTSSEFQTNARMGLVRAAVLGLLDPAYNTTTNVQAIPHMDGFPNGRRLEDDVTTIELQAVGGLVLAAVGLGFDDAVQGDYSDLVSTNLVAELAYNAGPTANDLPLLSAFPYLPNPHEGYSYVKQLTAQAPVGTSVAGRGFGIGPNSFKLQQNYPNPFNPETIIEYDLKKNSRVVISIYNTLGQKVSTLYDGEKPAGQHRQVWDGRNDKGIKLATGTYIYQMEADGVTQSKKMLLLK